MDSVYYLMVQEVKMFFHDKPGWAIALRIVLVLILIGGVAWAVQAAFYKGYAVGAGKDGYGSPMPFADGDEMGFHHQDTYFGHQRDSRAMLYHHPGANKPFHGYSGGMGYSSSHNFGGGFLHIILGILGLFLLGKLIFGFGGMRTYRRYGPGGRGRHYGHYYHHPGHCPCCSEEGLDEEVPETSAETKTTRKTAKK